MLPALFSLTLFVSAALLFWVQLLTSKMLLPILGGSAAVWNTCMMFFQIALLLGYLYAHLTSRKQQGLFGLFLHPLLLLGGALALPVTLAGIHMPSSDTNPILWLLPTLLVMIGGPFLILSGSAPLLQTWFAKAAQKSSSDPYYLYAASNLGSLSALLSYPTLIEPHFHLAQQSHYWTVGYYILIGLTTLCALSLSLKAKTASPTFGSAQEADPAALKPTTGQRLYWVLLAFVPSSLLLGVTTHLTTDVAAAPLFWVVPLVLYLLTFVLAFQRLVVIPLKAVAFAQAALVLALAVVFLSDLSDDVIPLFVLNLAAFFVTALMCHQQLAEKRPSSQHLTEFYLLLSLGGALGGVFNALLAPLIFNDILEYPLLLVLACMLRPGALPNLKSLRTTIEDFALPLGLAVLLVLIARHTKITLQDLSNTGAVLTVLLISFVVFATKKRPIRFGLCIAALIAAGYMLSGNEEVLTKSRNFYGVLKVLDIHNPPLHVLYNGTTLHGSQAQDPTHHMDPLTYYHYDGPLGHLFRSLKGTSQTQHVALVGLGAGTTACYEKPGEHWTFFEINPADIAIAKNPAYFTFLKDCPAEPNIIVGDARLSLAQQPDASFDMILLDAFTSDAIPIHLITQDAVELYLKKLRPGGLILFHISNRHLALGPVVGNVAASLNLTARRWDDDDDDDDVISLKKEASDWVIVARNAKDLDAIKAEYRWKPLPPSAGDSVWTDDYSDLLRALLY